MKRILLVMSVAALMAAMLVAMAMPAFAQLGPGELPPQGIAGKAKAEQKKKVELPPTGGPSMMVPTAAMLLVGSGILGYAVLRRR